MKTPWGDVAVRDAHVHYFSHRFFSVLAQQKGGLPAEALGPLLGWEIPSPGPEALAARWVSELDRSAVESAIVIASVPGDEDSVIAAVELYPERFSGYFMVDPTVADAPGRVSRTLGRGMRGVCLFPAMQGYSVTDARVYAVLEEASRHPRAEVFVHCGVLTLGVRRKLGLPGVFDTRNSNPLDLIPVAARFQSLTFVVPHFGAGFLREALMLCDLCPNVVLDIEQQRLDALRRVDAGGRFPPRPGCGRAASAPVWVRFVVLPAGLEQGHSGLTDRRSSHPWAARRGCASHSRRESARRLSPAISRPVFSE